jgi:hypothetical protein
MADDLSQSISAAENALRELIDGVLTESIGQNWLPASGLSPERQDSASARRDEEARRRSPVQPHSVLIDYLELSDLATIVDKQWDRRPAFAKVLGRKARFKADMERLIQFRNPQMHGRDLVPYEAHLAHGISGEIRARVTKWRTERTDEQRFFPRIERVTDSFGQVATRSNVPRGKVLKPGDIVEFRCEAFDPHGAPIDWAWRVLRTNAELHWFEGSSFTWTVDPAEVGVVDLRVQILSRRNFHLHEDMDDLIDFSYLVIPPEPRP